MLSTSLRAALLIILIRLHSCGVWDCEKYLFIYNNACTRANASSASLLSWIIEEMHFGPAFILEYKRMTCASGASSGGRVVK